MNPISFCPQCTTEWDRPWYDICPACGHRFIGRPWWQAPLFILLLICLPAIAVTAYRLLTTVIPGFEANNMELVASGIALFGVPLGSVAAAVILSLRMGKKGLAVAGWTMVWGVPFVMVSVTLTFFSCVY